MFNVDCFSPASGYRVGRASGMKTPQATRNIVAIHSFPDHKVSLGGYSGLSADILSSVVYKKISYVAFLCYTFILSCIPLVVIQLWLGLDYSGAILCKSDVFVLFGPGDEYWHGASDALWAEDGKHVPSCEG